MKKIRKFAMYVLLATLCASAVGQAPTASELLQKGIYLEETAGNLDEAIRVYKQVVQMAAVSRVNAAQAEYRIGACLQKKGHKAEAISTFQKLVREYPEQVEIVAKAREFLPIESKLQDNANPCHALENQIADNPQDIWLREKTISCYWDAQIKAGFNSERVRELEKGRVEHVLWLIQNAPDRSSARGVRVSDIRSLENYIRIKEAWMSQVQTHPTDANVLANAADFMDSREADKAEELASSAYTLDPKSIQAARVLAEVCERKMIRAEPGPKIKMAQQALQLREQIRTAMDPGQEYPLQELTRLAVDAFEAGDTVKAQKYAQDLARHDNADALHHGNLILGRLALKNGNMTEAKERLLAAGKNSGSPVLGSFGPNMVLARDLLLKGEQEVVLQYFDECEKFWKTGGNKLNDWRQAVRQGRIPDFEGNLVY